MIKCEKCGAQINDLLIETFNYDGTDSFKKVEIHSENGCVSFDADASWCGYNLSEEEMMDTIMCPVCKEFPFKSNEIHISEIIEVICFEETQK